MTAFSRVMRRAFLRLRPPPYAAASRARALASRQDGDGSNPPAPPQPTAAPTLREVVPGLGSAACVGAAGFAAAGWAATALAVPISGVPAAIALGMAARSAVGGGETLEPGLKVATTSVLRTGIVCVG